LTAGGTGDGVTRGGIVKGVAVAASSTSDIDTILGNASGGGSGGVAASVAVNVVSTETKAELDGSAVATGVVHVGADNLTTIDTIGVAGSGAGSAAGGAVSDTSVVHNDTGARIGDGAVVAATQAVQITALAREDLSSIAVGAGGGGSVGIAGSASVAVVGNATDASIGAASVSSNGDVSVQAEDETRVFEVAGALALGGSGGIGGAVAVVKLANQTQSEIGSGAAVDASGTTRVSARSLEDVDTYAVAGAGGGTVGAGASVGVKVLESDTEAAIGGGAAVNQDPAFAAAGQRVEIEAKDTVDVVGAAGGISGGGGLGVGASSDTTIVRNTTTATIGSAATVAASDDVVVRADSDKRVDSFAIGAAGGGSAGVTGSVSVIAIGSDLSGRASDALAGSDDGGNQGTTGGYLDGQTSDSAVGDALGEGENPWRRRTGSIRRWPVTVAGDLRRRTVSHVDTQALSVPAQNVTAGVT
jgi:hypothetical protein